MGIIRIEKYNDNCYRIVEYLHNQFSHTPKKLKNVVEKSDDDIFFESEQLSLDSKERFSQSVSRARSRVREIALCNYWDYFCTFTLNEEKQDRFDIDGFVRDFGYWIGNYNKKFNTNLKYLVVPEQHKNGAWHMHGLLSGVSPDSVITNEHGYLTMPYYEKRFGFINLSEIMDSNKTATYVAKYITKSDCALESKKHLFYSSRGLNGKMIVDYYQTNENFKSEWYNEYVGISWKNADEIADIIMNNTVG